MSCEYLRDHALKIINFNRKKMKLLEKEQEESYEKKSVIFLKKNFKTNI